MATFRVRCEVNIENLPYRISSCTVYFVNFIFQSVTECEAVTTPFVITGDDSKVFKISSFVNLQETQKLEAEAQKLEREIENLRKQKTQLQFVLDAHQPTCCGNVPPLKMETGDAESDCSSSLPQAMRPSSLPISGQLATTTCQSSFDFGLGSTGFTPIVSSRGVGVFLGTGSDIVSPTTLLLSPTTMTV